MRRMYRFALACILTSHVEFFSSPAYAEDMDAESSDNPGTYVYGGDCAQLSRLSRHEISAVVHPAHTDDFDRFCVAQGIYSCGDYSALLAGAGTLESHDSFGCNFVPTHP